MGDVARHARRRTVVMRGVAGRRDDGGADLGGAESTHIDSQLLRAPASSIPCQRPEPEPEPVPVPVPVGHAACTAAPTALYLGALSHTRERWGHAALPHVVKLPTLGGHPHASWAADDVVSSLHAFNRHSSPPAVCLSLRVHLHTRRRPVLGPSPERFKRC